MLPDLAISLSLVDNLPRIGLVERLRADDPALREIALDLQQEATAACARAAAANIHAIAWHDPAFPPQLLATPDCPPALWYRGSLICLDAPLVAIVGSRAATAVALETAAQLASELASRGVTVVSGLARGVDSAAHRGALQTGRTIAVLGSGIDRIYPHEHRRLADDIARDGLVLSEYPPASPALPFHFPLRNRIISGLSRAVVVIEASEKSGSLITASCALEQGREVMVVPGNVLTGRNRGGHALIRDGARIVECADDVLEEIAPAYVARGSRRSPAMAGSCDPILAAMDPGEPYELDHLAVATGLGPATLLTRMVELELSGQVRRIEGGRFMRPA